MGELLLFLAALFLPPLTAGCGIDTEGTLAARDTTPSDDDGTDGDGSADVDAGDSRPDGDVPRDPHPDEGAHPDAETEGPATCAEMPASFCDDGLDCTKDECVDGTGGPSCENSTLEGFCLIDGVCFTAWLTNLENNCQVCNPSFNDAWTPVEDGTLCYWGGGLCCSGFCFLDAECCSDADCTGCTGVAEPCGSFFDEDTCSSHAGCSWVPSVACIGGMSCNTWNYDEETCNFCECSYGTDDCGPWNQYFPCHEHFSSRSDCENYTDCGCYWVDTGGSCHGAPRSCSDFDESDCDDQPGCGWVESGTCSVTDHLCE